MVSLRRNILHNAFTLSDLVVMALSFVLATSIASYERNTVTIVQLLSTPLTVQTFLLFLTFLFAWYSIFSFCHLYNSRPVSSPPTDIVSVTRATTLGTLVLSVAAILLRVEIITPVSLVAFWTITTFTTAATRLLLKFLIIRHRMRGRNLRHVVLVGTNRRAVQFAQHIQAQPELGYRIVGFVDDEYANAGMFRASGYTLVSSIATFPAFLRENVVDEVVNALPMKSRYDQASKIVALCAEQGIIARSLSDIFPPLNGKVKAEHLESDSVITVYSGSMQDWPVLVKRALDFSVSSLLIILLAPFLLFIAFLITVSSPGPALFVQQRVGLNKRRFRLYKFRTMVPDAEKKLSELEHLNEASGPVFKIKQDPRITPLGRILRRTSIDELPQLLNVLKGDMSLVGPRPLPVRDYNGFDQDWQRRRFSVRPGLTCLWQVNGRSDVSFERWMELDMEYIDNWCLSLDIRILAKTIPAVLLGSGAA